MSQQALEPPAHEFPDSLWRNRDFLLLWFGQGVSVIGNEMTRIAFPVLFLALTASPAQAGLLGAVRFLPYILFGLLAGALVDRWDRKRTMQLCDLASALVVGSVPVALLLGQLSIAQLYLVVFVEGTLALFYNLANAASLPRIVARTQLADASARQQVSFSSGSVLGPSLFGLLAGLGGVALPFVVDAVSYLVSLLSLAFVRRSLQETREHAPRPILQEVREGVVWLWQHPVVRFLALLMGGLNLASGGFALIVLVIAQNGGASEFEIGLIFAAGGLGALAGAFLIGPLRRRFAAGPLMVGATWVWAFTWLPYAVVTTPLALALANMVGFVVVSIHSSVQYSYRLGQIPDRLQGRVNAVFRLLLFGSMSLGMALTGLLLQTFGPVTTVLLTFVPQLALALVAALHRPFRTASE